MTHFDQNDPRLTAFALGELTGAERAEFETHVASCGECARLVEELRQLGELVTAGLRHDGAVPEKLTQLVVTPFAHGDTRIAKRPSGTHRSLWAALAATIVITLSAKFFDLNRIWEQQAMLYNAEIVGDNSGLSPPSHSPVAVDEVWLEKTENGKKGTAHDSIQVELNRQAPSSPLDPVNSRLPLETVGSPISPQARPTPRLDINTPFVEYWDFKPEGFVDQAPDSMGAVKGKLGGRFNDNLRMRGANPQKNVDRDQSGSGKNPVPTGKFTSTSPASSVSEANVGDHAPRTAAPSPGDASASKSENHFYMPAAAAPAPTATLPSGNSAPQPGMQPNSVRQVTSAVPKILLVEESESKTLSELREGRVPSGQDFNTESYARIHDNPFLDSKTNPLSTFSIDVDTGSYSNVRRFLTGNQLPPPDAVRIEELLNYFSYDYAPPTGEHPFAAHVEVASAPWMPAHRLVRVGIKGKIVTREQRPAANLVFLIDVSGSMSSDNKLPLVKKALKLLVEQLDEKDRVSLVVYAGASGLVLDTTPAYQKETILTAIDRLQSGGSTNGGAGIQLAYAKATEAFIKEGVNRVILATDGDFNVGVTNQGELTRLIEKEAKSGVFLSVLGFGMGNLKDATLEQLADKGNGTYGYIDTFAEARKVFVEQVNGTLVTIAKDVKIQIEFNPAQVASYRLIGYENRLLRKEDFNDDTKDAGEIGAGHTVTALYEVVPVGVNTRPANPATPAVDPLKYQTPAATPMPVEKLPDAATAFDELLTLKLRYKQPDGDKSTLVETPVKDSKTSFEQASGDLRFAASVAAFGMRLRGSEHAGDISWTQIIDFARRATGEDANGYRHEFVTLAEQAAKLSGKK